MKKDCIENVDVNFLRYLNSHFDMLNYEYQTRFKYMSTSIDIKKLDTLWTNFKEHTAEHKNDLECFLGLKMLLEQDPLALAIFREVGLDSTVSFKEAFSDAAMKEFVIQHGATDETLAYLTGVRCFDDIDNL